MNPMKMGRIEIVEELRKYTRKPELDDMLRSSTASLRASLAYALSSFEDRTPRPRTTMTVPEFVHTFGRMRLTDTQKKILNALEERRGHTVYMPRHAGKATLRKLWRERVSEYHRTKAHAARLLDMGAITEKEAKDMVRKCFDV